MTAKEFLGRIEELEKEIVRKKQRCKTLRDVATNTSVNNSAENIQKSKEKSPLEHIMVKVVALEREIDADEGQLLDLKVEDWEQLDVLRDERHQKILWLHYAERKSWSKIASKMSMSRRHVLRLHKVALEEFEKILKKSPNVTTMSSCGHSISCGIIYSEE